MIRKTRGVGNSNPATSTPAAQASSNATGAPCDRYALALGLGSSPVFHALMALAALTLPSVRIETMQLAIMEIEFAPVPQPAAPPPAAATDEPERQQPTALPPSLNRDHRREVVPASFRGNVRPVRSD